MSRVVCLCSACGLQTYTDDNGAEHPGNRVAPSTRINHERRDREAAASAARPVAPVNVPVAPQPVRARGSDLGASCQINLAL